MTTPTEAQRTAETVAGRWPGRSLPLARPSDGRASARPLHDALSPFGVVAKMTQKFLHQPLQRVGRQRMLSVSVGVTAVSRGLPGV